MPREDTAGAAALIRRVRACPGSGRGELARLLACRARAGSDAAFAELCRMARGDRRTLLVRYSFEDQLAGIDALGRTGREDARRLLSSWLDCREIYVESCTGLACGSDHTPQWTALAYEFPRAPRRLAEKLRYTGPLSPPGVRPASLTPREHAERRKQNPCHDGIARAVSRLRDAVGLAGCGP